MEHLEVAIWRDHNSSHSAHQSSDFVAVSMETSLAHAWTNAGSLAVGWSCGKDARGDTEPGELPPGIVLQQHIWGCPPVQQWAAERRLAVASKGTV